MKKIYVGLYLQKQTLQNDELSIYKKLFYHLHFVWFENSLETI